jgi:molybdopterin synthase catalytic subunit
MSSTTTKGTTGSSASASAAATRAADAVTGSANAAADAVRLLDVRDTALSVDEVLRAVTDPHVGGIALFVGTVRDHTPEHPGEQVTELEYTAHPTALAQLRAVADDVAAAHPGTILAAVHRTGDLTIGDLAVVVAAAAPHRAEAFAACRELIDTLKEQVPIWKREQFRNGSHTWVGM